MLERTSGAKLKGLTNHLSPIQGVELIANNAAVLYLTINKRIMIK
jgi:hypothetical protein